MFTNYLQGDCLCTFVQVSSSRALDVIFLSLHPRRNVCYDQCVIFEGDVIVRCFVYPVSNVIILVNSHIIRWRIHECYVLAWSWDVELSQRSTWGVSSITSTYFTKNILLNTRNKTYLVIMFICRKGSGLIQFENKHQFHVILHCILSWRAMWIS